MRLEYEPYAFLLGGDDVCDTSYDELNESYGDVGGDVGGGIFYDELNNIYDGGDVVFVHIGDVGDTFYDELNAFVCVLLGEPLLGGSLRQRSSWKES